MQIRGLHIHINRTELVLLPQKLLYIPEFSTICLADWHLGKAAHFRKSGILLPQPDIHKEYALVNAVLEELSVKTVLFLGDLFHSVQNNDWYSFAAFINHHPEVTYRLIQGNHDIIPTDLFESLRIEVSEQWLLGDRLLFSHEPLLEKTPQGLLNVAGHIHPGYRLLMKARQSFTLPCFYYSQSTLIIPAFGNLTGLYVMGRENGQEVFCVVGDEVVAV